MLGASFSEATTRPSPKLTQPSPSSWPGANRPRRPGKGKAAAALELPRTSSHGQCDRQTWYRARLSEDAPPRPVVLVDMETLIVVVGGCAGPLRARGNAVARLGTILDVVISKRHSSLLTLKLLVGNCESGGTEQAEGKI